MNFLFFDTETTGLPRNYKAPASDINNWPRLIQLGWILTDQDGAEKARFDSVIRPDGFSIPEASSEIHGVTTDRAIKEGIELKSSLYLFKAALAAADVVIGHNVAFDTKIMAAEFYRCQIKNSLESMSSLCTMEASTDYCALPGKYGLKWPKLIELHEKLFGEGFEDAHSAIVDIEATVRCFLKLSELGLIQPAKAAA